MDEKQKKTLIVIGTLIIIGIILFVILKYSFGIGPCFGYQQVGEYNQTITSEEEAKQFALDYYSSIGYDFDPESLTVYGENENRWQIRWVSNFKNEIESPELCHEYTKDNFPECIGQVLILEENWFGKNKIITDYGIGC